MTTGHPRGSRAEVGAASVVVAAAAATVLSLTMGLILVAGSFVAGHRARAAADLSALAAATRLHEGGGAQRACVEASRVARANEARLTSCRPTDDGTVTVRVAVPLALAPAGVPDVASAVARAGPRRFGR